MNEREETKGVWQLLLGAFGQAIKVFQEKGISVEEVAKVEDEFVEFFKRKNIPLPVACAILCDFLACIEHEMVKNHISNLSDDVSIFWNFITSLRDENEHYIA